MPNIRLQKYKKNRILGMNKYNAAIAAGYSESTAKSRGKDLEEKAKIGDILERKGLTDSFLAGKVLELIEAYDFIFKRDTQGNSEIIGDKRLCQPNWTARAKGLDLALRLKDLLKDEIKHSGSVEFTHFFQAFIAKPLDGHLTTGSRN